MVGTELHPPKMSTIINASIVFIILYSVIKFFFVAVVSTTNVQQRIKTKTLKIQVLSCGLFLFEGFIRC